MVGLLEGYGLRGRCYTRFWVLEGSVGYEKRVNFICVVRRNSIKEGWVGVRYLVFSKSKYKLEDGEREL